MKTLFKKQHNLKKNTTSNVPKEVIEKEFIISFFKELPIESLKKLINFKEIDFKDKNLWFDSMEDKGLYELLCKLRYFQEVQYTCELLLETENQ